MILLIGIFAFWLLYLERFYENSSAPQRLAHETLQGQFATPDAGPGVCQICLRDRWLAPAPH
jgi:hypothetical protein